MESHLQERHPNIRLADPKNREAETNFQFKIHQRYKSAMDRQLAEAICIARNGGMGSETIMNRKDEFGRCLIPELEMKGRNTQVSAKKDEQKRLRKPEEEEHRRNAKKHKMSPQHPNTTPMHNNTETHTRTQETHTDTHVEGDKEVTQDTQETQIPVKSPTAHNTSQNNIPSQMSPQDPKETIDVSENAQGQTDGQTRRDSEKKIENEEKDKETQEPQETQKQKEKKETTRKTEKRNCTKRKRETQETQDVKIVSTENTETPHICNVTQITSHKSIIDVIKSGFGTKQTKSKLTQKPVFKTRKKSQSTAQSAI